MTTARASPVKLAQVVSKRTELESITYKDDF